MDMSFTSISTLFLRPMQQTVDESKKTETKLPISGGRELSAEAVGLTRGPLRSANWNNGS